MDFYSFEDMENLITIGEAYLEKVSKRKNANYKKLVIRSIIKGAIIT
jgi:hypothetical protein